MSFGWSAGDIISAISLVTKIINSTRTIGGSASHFQELESELQGLSRALQEISSLSCIPGQIPEIVALKFAACLCEDTLKRFHEKIRPFEESLGVAAENGPSRVKKVPKMVRWELLVRKEVPELRSYLVAHVGSLNLRLNTALLKVATKSSVGLEENQRMQQSSAMDIKRDISSQSFAICERIAAISETDTIPRLDYLLTVATNVWKAQIEMMDSFSKAMQNIPPPDLTHTWAQAPVKFEDALGRVIPVPSEYNWDKLEAIIKAQFKTGPGHAKVRSGEFELFDVNDDVRPIDTGSFLPLPGMSIRMAFIVGQYMGSERCPRSGCRSTSFANAQTRAAVRWLDCRQCGSWFRMTRSSLPKPLKPPDLGDVSTGFFGSYGSAPQMLSGPGSGISERRKYKNISIYITDLPPTPKQFRDKNHRKYSPSSLLADLSSYQQSNFSKRHSPIDIAYLNHYQDQAVTGQDSQVIVPQKHTPVYHHNRRATRGGGLPQFEGLHPQTTTSSGSRYTRVQSTPHPPPATFSTSRYARVQSTPHPPCATFSASTYASYSTPYSYGPEFAQGHHQTTLFPPQVPPYPTEIPSPFQNGARSQLYPQTTLFPPATPAYPPNFSTSFSVVPTHAQPYFHTTPSPQYLPYSSQYSQAWFWKYTEAV